MPSPPRILLPDYPVLITTRIQEGLPLIASPWMKLALAVIFAKAQEQFGVTLCHYIVMANHLHLILVVKCADSIAVFMNYIKTESAHIVNAKLGRRQRSVWCKGYDALPILTLENTIDRIAYLYANPSRADLVNNIDEYPNLSSWSMFTEGRSVKKVPYVRRCKMKECATAAERKEEARGDERP